MKARVPVFAALMLGALLACAAPALAQGTRLDAIWARTAPGPITLDGKLNEPAWAQAESVVIRYGVDNGLPGSGWKNEIGGTPSDPTYAVLKFLVVGNVLYMGATVRDSSIGGSNDLNRCDGFLINLRDHSSPYRPAPDGEYTYMWWDPLNPGTPTVGLSPGFIGKWGTYPPYQTRTAQQIANWNAVTVVHGLSNSDSSPDTGYTTEMLFNLPAMGYDATKPQGDIMEFNISIYDADWMWPTTISSRATGNRTWWQGPWDNTGWYDEVRIWARPDVTTSSGPAPVIPVELRIPNANTAPSPVIDGRLTEPVWSAAPSFDIRYGDDALRSSYPNVGAFRGGQFQNTVNGGQASILDPGDATVKYFFKGDSLFLGFDVRDQVVQYVSDFSRWDGFIVTINDRATRGPDNNLPGHRLSFQVGPDGSALAQDFLPSLIASGGARLALALKGGTTVDTLGQQADSGYTAELVVDLTKLGYPSGLGDHVLFLGINLLDGDSWTPWTSSTGTHTWWYREYENMCCPIWAYLDPNLTVGVEDSRLAGRHVSLLQNTPNPFRSTTTIRYQLAEASDVTLKVYDPQGREVGTRVLGFQKAGPQQVAYGRPDAGSGAYFYRLIVTDHANGLVKDQLTGRMMLLK